MALRVPDYETFLAADDFNKRIWWSFMQSVVNDLPLNGNVAPENTVRANKSCLYIETTGGTAVLWFNPNGNGSATGWIVK
jgi:hypothetical protein